MKSKRHPRCFENQPELAAPFVAEISAFIRCKQLDRRATRVTILRESVTEPAYDRAGGREYIELRDAMESAQERYIAGIRARRSAGSDVQSIDVQPLRIEMESLQTAFYARRQRHESFVDEQR